MGIPSLHRNAQNQAKTEPTPSHGCAQTIADFLVP